MRTAFSATDLPFILRAYVDGIQKAFIVAIALACACTIIAIGAKWQKMQSPPNPREANAVGSSTKDEEAGAVV